MRITWGWIVVAVTLLGAPAAKACVPNPDWPSAVKMDEREAAVLLVKSASFIDLAEVETLTPDPIQAARGGQWFDDDAVLIRLRIIQRLKGNPATPLRDLSGVAAKLPPPPPPNFRLRATRPSPPFKYLPYEIGHQELSQVPVTDCYWLDAIGAMPGEKVLVFRDVDGGLLNIRVPVRYKGKYQAAWGPSFAMVSGPDDPWVKLVDKEITDQGPRYFDEGDYPSADGVPQQGPAGDPTCPQAAPAPGLEGPQDSLDRRL